MCTVCSAMSMSTCPSVATSCPRVAASLVTCPCSKAHYSPAASPGPHKSRARHKTLVCGVTGEEAAQLHRGPPQPPLPGPELRVLGAKPQQPPPVGAGHRADIGTSRNFKMPGECPSSLLTLRIY